MIFLIQAIVIFVAVGIVMAVLIGRQTHAARAWKKLALCLLAIAMVVAAVFPDATSVIARFVGVGRGADLLLYMLTLAFIGYVINNYLHEQKMRETIYKLARKLALYEAKTGVKRQKGK